MNKVFLSSFVIVSFVSYAVYGNSSQLATNNKDIVISDALNRIKSFHQDSDDGFQLVKPQNSSNPNIVKKPDTNNVVTNSSPSVPTETPTPVVIHVPKGMYVDGTYTGPAVDVYYGVVQIQAVISGGKLANVSFLSYPNDRPESLRKSNRAMPILIQEAIQVQSAQVDIVTGASFTSGGFTQSLGVALDQAKA